MTPMIADALAEVTRLKDENARLRTELAEMKELRQMAADDLAAERRRMVVILLRLGCDCDNPGSEACVKALAEKRR